MDCMILAERLCRLCFASTKSEFIFLFGTYCNPRGPGSIVLSHHGLTFGPLGELPDPEVRLSSSEGTFYPRCLSKF